MNLEELIRKDLEWFYPDLNDGEKYYYERVKDIRADNLIKYSEELAQKVFEATKQLAVKKARVGMEGIFCWVEEETITNIKIEDLDLP